MKYLFLLLAASLLVARAAASCASLPPTPANGHWFCYNDDDSSSEVTCSLECNPGFVPINKSRTACQESSWEPPYAQMSCGEAAVLITGGDDASSIRKNVEVYASGFHLQLPDLPDERWFHSVDYVNGHTLLCGGGDTKTSCLKLQTNDFSWNPHSNLTSTRYYHSSEQLRGDLFLFGGYSGLESYFSSEFLDPEAGTMWSKGLHIARGLDNGCTVRVSDDEVMVLSGVDSNSMFKYNMSSGATTEYPELPPSADVWFSCCYIDDAPSEKRGIIVAGGGSDMFYFDLAAEEWFTLPSLNTVRERASTRLVVMQGNIYIFGGFTGSEEHSATVEMFDLSTNMWSYADNMIVGREYHAITTVPLAWFK